MGSKTRLRNALRHRHTRLVIATVRKPEKELTDDEVRFLAENPRRHKCVACGTGGHGRRAPIGSSVNKRDEIVPIRPATRLA